MKVMYHGKEIELDDTIEPGEKELDMLTPVEDDIEKTQEYDFNFLNESGSDGNA